MSRSVEPWLAVDGGGAPLTGLSPTFVQYCTRNGVDRPQPTIRNLGFGLYDFVAPDADVALGVVYVIDDGLTARERYWVGNVNRDADPFDALLLTDGGNNLWTSTGPGQTPLVGAYTSVSAAARTPATLHSVKGLGYLYYLQPSLSDRQVGTAYRVDSPAGAAPQYWTGGWGPDVLSTTVALAPEAGIQPENVAVEALKQWLLLNLAAKVGDANATRAAVLRASSAGPYLVPSGAKLQVGTTAVDKNFTTVTLTSGSSVDATQLMSDINGATSSTIADVDEFGRLRLTSATPPDAPSLANSVVAVGPDNLGTSGAATGSNAARGWSPGGEKVVVTPLVAPPPSGIFDGWPKVLAPAAGQKAFRIVIDSVGSQPAYGDKQIRRDEYNVQLELALLDPLEPNESYRSKEHIRSAARCVRGLLMSTVGRQLGRGGYGDVQLVTERQAQFGTVRFKQQSGSDFYDVASMGLTVRVFGRPPSS